jgi:hypothetical protein
MPWHFEHGASGRKDRTMGCGKRSPQRFGGVEFASERDPGCNERFARDR